MLIQLSKRYLAVLTAAALLAYVLVWAYTCRPVRRPHPAHAAMLEAAGTMKRAAQQVALERRRSGWRPGPEDPNATGLIGVETSVITTTLGNLSAKRTATNPNFAALVVRLLWEAGVRPGDTVAASFSGSFPGLNIATMAAGQALRLRLIVISSVGASSWGANLPTLTWPDLERLLIRAHVLADVPTAVTLGGGEDLGHGFSAAGLAAAQAAARRSGFPLLKANSWPEQLKTRLDFYTHAAGRQPIKAYVNVGGNAASLGVYPASERIAGGLNPGGVLLGLPKAGEGNAHTFLRRGVPVLNLLDVRSLALRYGLPVDPVPLPEPGQGGIYERAVPVALRWAGVLLLSFLTGVVAWVGAKEAAR